MSAALRLAAAALVAFLIFLLLPEGPIALVGFEVLLLMMVWQALRRLVPSEEVLETVDAPPFWRRRRRNLGPMLPMSLRRVERLIRYSESRPYLAHQRLLPLLRELASDRLLAGHGVDLEQDQGQAARLLGEDGWRILGPQGIEAPHRATDGVSHAQIDAAVSAIENL